jgi:hypothetical protein
MHKLPKLQYLIILFGFIFVSFKATSQSQPFPITPQPDEKLCWNFDEAQLSIEETFEDFIDEVEHGSGVYTNYELHSPDVERIGLGVYQVPAEAPVELFLQIYSPEQEEQQIRYIVIIDEHQIDINGHEEPFFDVTLSPEKIASYTIPLPPLDEGIHDIVILPVQNIDTLPTPTGMLGVSNLRMTLLVGNAAEVEEKSIQYRTLQAISTVEAEGQLLTLTLGDSLLQWSYPEPAYNLTVNEPLSFNILSGYSGNIDMGFDLPEPEVSNFALLMFLDYSQVPISPDEEVLYAEVDQTTAYAQIPVEIAGFESEGTREVMAVRINYPRVPLCILQGPVEGYFLNAETVYNRAAVNVVTP